METKIRVRGYHRCVPTRVEEFHQFSKTIPFHWWVNCSGITSHNPRLSHRYWSNCSLSTNALCVSVIQMYVTWQANRFNPMSNHRCIDGILSATTFDYYFADEGMQ